MKRPLWWEFVLIGLAIVMVVLAFPGQGVLAQDNLSFVDAPGSPIEVKDAWYGAIGDFNEDGHQDIAVLCGCYYAAIAGKWCNYMEGGIAAVSILLGNGDGTFSGPRYFPVGDGSWSSTAMVAADFNGDGHLDLLVANPGTGKDDVGAVGVFLLVGDGKGNFSQAGFSHTGSGPYEMAVSDFDHDGNLDVAVACSNFLWGHRITLLFGDGNGGFARHDVMLPLGTPLADIEAADFNGDGWMDLATANDGWENAFVLLARPGRGRERLFSDFDVYTMGYPVNSLAAGDLDEDGDVDLAVSVNDHLVILLNNGRGKFTPGSTIDTPDVFDSRVTVAVDLNGDGHLDVASLDYYGGEVGIYLGSGDGNFYRPVWPLFSVKWSDFETTMSNLKDYPTSVPASLKSVFGDHGITLSTDARVRLIQPATWQIIDKSDIYLLRKDGSALDVYASCSPVISPAPDWRGRFWTATWLGVEDLDEDGRPDLTFIGKGADFRGVAVKLSRPGGGDGAS